MSMDIYAEKCAEWLQSQVDRAENTDSALRPLKEKINDLTKAVREANSRAEPDEQTIKDLLARQDEAIFALIQHVASKGSHKGSA